MSQLTPVKIPMTLNPSATSDQSGKSPLPRISEISGNDWKDKEETIIRHRSNPLLSKSNIDSTTPNHIDSNDASLNISLNDLFREILEVKDILLTHVHSTSQASDGIKAEITSIKNLCIVRLDSVQSKVEEVTDTTVTRQKDLSNVSSNVNNKLQSISDRLGQTKQTKNI